MADEKLNTGPGEEKLPEAPAPVTVDEPQAPAPEQTAAPTPQQEGPAQPEPGDVVVSFDKINELMLYNGTTFNGSTGDDWMLPLKKNIMGGISNN